MKKAILILTLFFSVGVIMYDVFGYSLMKIIFIISLLSLVYRIGKLLFFYHLKKNKKQTFYYGRKSKYSLFATLFYVVIIFIYTFNLAKSGLSYQYLIWVVLGFSYIVFFNFPILTWSVKIINNSLIFRSVYYKALSINDIVNVEVLENGYLIIITIEDENVYKFTKDVSGKLKERLDDLINANQLDVHV